MAQQYIDFGTFPNDPAADPIRAAFQKIQTNFNELYNTTQTAGVNELTVGPGLSQNRTVGDIYLTANIPNITIQTSTSLLVGVGAATGNTATISSFNTPFVLNLANTITTANANLTNSVRAGNLTVVNTVSSNLIPSANVTYDLGSSTQRWRDLYLSGTTIFLGPQSISANASSVSFANISVTSNIAAGNVFVTSTFSSNSVTVSSNVTTANLTVSSNVLSNLNPVSNETYDLGVTGRRWKSVFAGNVTVSNSINSTDISVTSNITTANLTVSSYVGGNLIPLTNEVYNLGNATHKWKDLFLSGNTLTLGSVEIKANSTSVLIPSLAVTSNLSAGTVTATFVDATITRADQPNITGLGLLDNLSVAGNIETGELSVVGNLTATTMNVTGSFSAATITGNVVVPPGGTVAAPGNSTQLLFNDGGDTAAVPGLTFDKTSNLLSISGNVAGGNITTSGALVVSGTANVGELGTSNVFASGNVSASNFITLGVLSASAGISSDGNITTSGFLSVIGNASVGNITTTTLSGQVVSVSGNVSGANLIASGILRVDGNASVGGLTTSGLVSAATLSASGNVSANGVITATGNITSSGTMIAGGLFTGGDLSVTGNASIGSLSATILNTSGNLIAGNLSTSGALLALGAITAASLNTSGNLTAGIVNSSTLSVVGTASAGNFEAQGTLSVTGNATTGNLVTGIVSMSGNLTVSAFANISNSLSVGSNLTVAGSANILNLEAASFQSNTANLNTINIPTGGLLSMATSNASIGNIAAGILEATGNVKGSNLIASGYLAVSGNASANRITAATGVITGSQTVGGSINIGTTVAITSASGTGSIVTLEFVAETSAPFPIGATITVAGIAPAAYNGTYTVTGSTTSTVQYTHTATGTLTVQGTAKTSGTGLILTGIANVGGLNTGNGTINAGSGNVTGGTFTATLFTGNGSSITGINLFNTGMSVIVTATAGTGSVATLSFATQSYAPFTAGQQITVSGIAPIAYNGTYTVLTCSTTSVTYTGTGTGSMVTTGTIAGGPKSAASLLSDTVVSSSQPNITSVGTLTGLTVGGTFTGSNITSSGFITSSVTPGVTATGSSLGAATVLTSQINVVSIASVGSDGVRLPGSTSGMQVIIINTTAVPIKVYPINGSQIDSLGTNASFPLGAGAKLLIVAVSTNQWYTMVGVYG